MARVCVGALAACCAIVFGACFATPVRAQDASAGVSVETNQQLFDVLCALDAAGFHADETTLGEMPARLALRSDLLKLQGPATEAVRNYYRDHAISDQGAMLSRFVTLALVLGPAPRFSFVVNEDSLPPDALALRDFQPLLGPFYEEAHLGDRWAKIEPEYDALAGGYRSLLRGVVIKTNAYLREIVRPLNGRAFTVYVDPLAGNSTNFRNLGDRYVVVAGVRGQSSTDEIQHAYLHFLLDPMVLKDQDGLRKKRALLEVAARAPRLPDQYRADFVSYVDECVIKAVELRLRDLPAAKQEEVLKQDDESGFVVVRPLVTGLLKFEKDQPSMSLYMPELIAGVNVDAEQKRLQAFAFPPVQSSAPNQQGAGQSGEKDALLEQGDRAIAAHDPETAATAFRKVLATEPNNSRALYGLAVASVLSGHAEESKTLFEKVIASSDSPDPAALAWSHVYLGRMDDLQSDRDLAVKEYNGALAVAGAPDSARIAAQRGVETPYAAPNRNRSAPQ